MWMFADGDRLRQHVRPEALGEGPLGLALPRRAAARGRRAGRRLQRRQRRQGRRRPDPRAPRHRRGELRRLDPDRPLHLRDRHPPRQARPGPRRGEEPHARAAGCRRRAWRRTRRCRPATARRASAAWRSPRSSRSATWPTRSSTAIRERLPKIKVGPGTDPTRRDGPARHAAAPRQGGLVPRQRRRAGRDGRGRRPRAPAVRRVGRLLPWRVAHRPGDAGHGLLPRRDLRAGADASCASRRTRGAAS